MNILNIILFNLYIRKKILVIYKAQFTLEKKEVNRSCMHCINYLQVLFSFLFDHWIICWHATYLCHVQLIYVDLHIIYVDRQLIYVNMQLSSFNMRNEYSVMHLFMLACNFLCWHASLWYRLARLVCPRTSFWQR